MPIPSSGDITDVLVYGETIHNNRNFINCIISECTVVLSPTGTGSFTDCEFVRCRFRTTTPRISGAMAQQLIWIHREASDKRTASRHTTTTTKARKGH